MNNVLRLSMVACTLALAVSAQRSISVVVQDGAGQGIAGAKVLRTMSFRNAYPPMLLSRSQFALGDVVERAVTNEVGIADLALPPATVDAMAPPRSVVFVQVDGRATKCFVVRRDDMPAGPQFVVRMTRLRPTSRIRVLTPDGKPAVGVRVRAVGMACGERGIGLVPEELVEEARTDESGHASFHALTGVAAVEVVHAELGRQFACQDHDRALREFRLRRVGRLTLQLSGEHASKLRGVRMRMWTEAKPAKKGMSLAAGARQVVGYAEGEFDGAGRLVIEKLAEGGVTLDPIGCDDSDWVPCIVWNKVLRAAGLELSLPVAQTRVTSGRVVDAVTKKGVSGVVVRSTDHGFSRMVTTDENGEFRCRVGTEPYSRTTVWRAPARFMMGKHGLARRSMPKAAKEQAAAPVELVLTTGATLRGRVVGTAGQPIPDAFVKATWKDGERFTMRTHSRHAFTGDDGEFEIVGLDATTAVRLEARGLEARSRPSTVSIKASKPITLRLESSASVMARGRVTDREGKPIAGAVVTIEGQAIPEGRTVGGAKQSKITSVMTDARGAWKASVASGRDLRVRVEREGFAVAGTAWFRQAPPSFDTRLRRIGAIRGRVVRGDEAVRATVLCPQWGARAACDDDGRFVLENVPEGDVLVVVRTESRDYARVLTEGGSLDLVPRGRRSVFEDDRLPARELARGILERLRKKLEEAGKVDSDLRFWQAYAAIDPALTLDWIDTRGFSTAWYGDATRRVMGQDLERESVAEALAVVRSMKSPYSRSLALSRISAQVATGERLGICFEALWSARRVQSPAQRLVMLSRAAEALHDAGAHEVSRRVFEEAEDIVGKLAKKEWPGYARACWATDTAHLDLAKSLAIIDEMPKSDRSRHWANIAHELAGVDPAKSFEVLSRTGLGTHSFNRNAARVAVRMAKRDKKRAHDLVMQVSDPSMRAYALAALAREVGSVEWIDEAIGLVEGAQGRDSGAVMLASMLDFIASAAPDRVGHAIARAIAMREARGTDPRHAWGNALENDCKLAAFLAAHDAEIARAVLRQAVTSSEYLITDRRKYDPRSFFVAAALLDPRLAVRVGERIATDHPQPGYKNRDSTLQAIAQSLATRDAKALRARLSRIVWMPTLEEDQ